MANPEVKIFRFEPIESVSSIGTFAPGQFIFLHLLDQAGNSITKRPYSISSSLKSPYLEFCIKIVNGAVTSGLDKLKIGDVIGVEGPLGHFTLKDCEHACFLAGGTGIAPIMSMLRSIAAADSNSDRTFVFIYSVKSFESIIYRQELEELERKNPRIKIIITLTQESSLGWNGEKGRISKEMMARYMTNVPSCDWWMCGPIAMIKSFREYALELGADPKRIKMEGWG